MIINKIGKKIFYLIIYLFILVLAFILVANLFGIKTYIVVSESMQNEVKKGSLSFILENNSLDKETLKINDIVVCKNEEMNIPLMHKIIYLDEEKIVTHGIMNEEGINEIFTYDEIIGKHLFSIPYLGYLKNLVISIYFWIIVVLVSIGYYIIKKIIRELNKN